MTILLTAAPTGYSALIASDAATVEAAQKLRYQVFAEELGATLHSEVAGSDVDEFDAYCDHLVVRHDASGEVVGTYRLLPPQRAVWLGRRYAETEFDMGGLTVLRDKLVEAGRSCVAPDHRNGAVINIMWAGIASYLARGGHRWLGGCASVPLADGGVTAAGVRGLTQKHLSPPELRVTPHAPWLPSAEPVGRVAVPPLLKGYLRLGAWVCGEPAYDRDFDCADFYVLLNLDRIDSKYLRHFGIESV
ncbi:putative hemolysin [Allocatelliglobosispora scoriae]|uniref:Putative hemolysin n=1 Tax=Allocatelliglobosispora scoriae TaxID=643052 RepID=A0A841BXD6_9ACTN|nr:GNAT family N-acyltransferase [Allocatelliglobosispora scoriae]MBB5871809.1 putative hemolysin [Allocatelliglobosispora scoriae]